MGNESKKPRESERKINILGTDYDFIESSADKEHRLARADGFHEFMDKVIGIEKNLLTDSGEYPNIEELRKRYRNQVLCHEIIHGYMYESGLSNFFTSKDEEFVVEWLVIQFPKMLKTFQEHGVI